MLDLKTANQHPEIYGNFERSPVTNSEEYKTQLMQATTLEESPDLTVIQESLNQTDPEAQSVQKAAPKVSTNQPKSKWLLAGALSLLILVSGVFGYRYFTAPKQIESIAVMPFVNNSGNQDVEYISDGMTDTIISSLSQLPNLSVKSRSSVYPTDARLDNLHSDPRYKDLVKRIGLPQ